MLCFFFDKKYGEFLTWPGIRAITMCIIYVLNFLTIIQVAPCDKTRILFS